MVVDVIEGPEFLWVDAQKICHGIPAVLSWWQWSAYGDTWRMVDENPEIDLVDLPLYNIMCRVARRKGSRDPERAAVRHVAQRVALYHEIREKGYDPYKERVIIVNIGPNGELLLADGHHRVSMALHLGVSSLRVRVRDRAPAWLALKRQLRQLYRKRDPGFLYQPIEHPDFAAWTVARSSEDRLGAILGALGPVDGCCGLDVGSCTGWFSHQLARSGARMVGVEATAPRVAIARTLSSVYRLQAQAPEFVHGTVEQYLERVTTQFDFCLLLSVLHHYVRGTPEAAGRKQGWTAERFLRLLATRSSSLFVDMGPCAWNLKTLQAVSGYPKIDRLLSGARPLYWLRRGG